MKKALTSPLAIPLIWNALLSGSALSLLLFLSLEVGPHAYAASDVQSDGAKVLDGYIGAGPMAFPTYPGSSRYQVWPVPLGIFEYRETAYVHLQKAGVRFWNDSSKKLALSVVAQPRFGYRENDGPKLSGMAVRRSRLEGGFGFEWDLSPVSINANYFFNTARESGGSASDITMSYEIMDNKQWGLDVFIGAEHLDKKTTHYYFGVSPEESTAFRPAYEPNATTNPYTGISGAYKFSGGYAALFGTTLEVLGVQAANSPIVVKRNGLTAYLGLAKSF